MLGMFRTQWSIIYVQQKQFNKIKCMHVWISTPGTSGFQALNIREVRCFGVTVIIPNPRAFNAQSMCLNWSLEYRRAKKNRPCIPQNYILHRHHHYGIHLQDMKVLQHVFLLKSLKFWMHFMIELIQLDATMLILVLLSCTSPLFPSKSYSGGEVRD